MTNETEHRYEVFVNIRLTKPHWLTRKPEVIDEELVRYKDLTFPEKLEEGETVVFLRDGARAISKDCKVTKIEHIVGHGTRAELTDDYRQPQEFHDQINEYQHYARRKQEEASKE
jgi:hypothetical protein